MCDLFERRLKRPLSAIERKTLSELVAKEGVGTVSAAILELPVEELASCITPLSLRLRQSQERIANEPAQ